LKKNKQSPFKLSPLPYIYSCTSACTTVDLNHVLLLRGRVFRIRRAKSRNCDVRAPAACVVLSTPIKAPSHSHHLCSQHKKAHRTTLPTSLSIRLEHHQSAALFQRLISTFPSTLTCQPSLLFRKTIRWTPVRRSSLRSSKVSRPSLTIVMSQPKTISTSSFLPL
jgi:hypothetical protein